VYEIVPGGTTTKGTFMNVRQAMEATRDIDLKEWGRQRTQYSRARRGRNERGANLAECSLVQGMTEAMIIRRSRVRCGPKVSVPGSPEAA